MRVLFSLFFIFVTFSMRADLLDELKLYRTYYFVETLSVPAHQFVIWVNMGQTSLDWRDYNLAVDSSESIGSLTQQDLKDTGVITAGFSLPPASSTLPESVEKIGAMLDNQIKIIFPGAKEIRVEYSGYFGRLRLIEVIPMNISDRWHERVGFHSEMDFEETQQQGLQPVLMAGMTGGYGVLNRLFTPGIKTLPFDFSLPAAIEGSALLTLGSPGLEGSRLHEETYERLITALGEFSFAERTKIDGDLVLSKLLRNQGEGVLPIGLRQMLKLGITIYGRSWGVQPQIQDNVTFLIPLDDALDGGLDLVETSANLGINLRLTGGIARNSLAEPRSLRLKIEDQTAKTSEELVFNVVPKDIFSAEPTSAVLGSLEISSLVEGSHVDGNNSGSLKVQLPGDERFASIDVFVDRAIFPSRLTGLPVGRSSACARALGGRR